MSNGIHPQTIVGAVHLNVRDLDRLLAYYEERIGLRFHWRDGRRAGLGVGERDLLILDEDPAARETTGTAGLYHFALLLPSRRELARALRHLAARETPLSGFADHLVSEAIYLSDPEGNGIEIYRDRPRNEWRRDARGTLQMDTIALDVRGLMATVAEDAEPWTGMPPGTTVGHIHLHVGDLAQSDAFYVGVLGFDLVLNYGHSANFISAGGYHHHIGYNLWAGRAHRPADALGLRWFDVRLPDDDALAAVRERLTEAGVAGSQEGDGWLVADPAGNRVRLVVA